MTRKIVAIENRLVSGNQFISLNALTWPTKPVPVFVHGDSLTKIVGMARGFERDLDGTITAEVTLTDTEYESYYCVIDIQDAQMQMFDNILKIRQGHIAGVAVTPYWTWAFAPKNVPGDSE